MNGDRFTEHNLLVYNHDSSFNSFNILWAKYIIGTRENYDMAGGGGKFLSTNTCLNFAKPNSNQEETSEIHTSSFEMIKHIKIKI